MDIESPSLTLMGCDEEEIAHGVFIITNMFRKHLLSHQEQMRSKNNPQQRFDNIPQEVQLLASTDIPIQHVASSQLQGHGNESVPTQVLHKTLPTIPSICQQEIKHSSTPSISPTSASYTLPQINSPGIKPTMMCQLNPPTV